MIEGTPLRKFGHFRVYQTKRGQYPRFAVNDTRTGARLVFSESHESANFAAERLAEGRPLQTPREAMDRSMADYAGIYPTRFAYYDHVYIVNGNGMDWINGGLADTDASRFSPEGRAMMLAREARRKAGERAMFAYYDSVMTEALKFLGEVHSREPSFCEEEDATRTAYLAGTWPDAMTPENAPRRYRDALADGRPLNTPYPPCRYSCMAELARGIDGVDPEWVDDARKASVLILTHGHNDPERPTENAMETIAGWAETLATRYGGRWTP